MRWFLFVLIFFSVPAGAFAQDCPDGTPEGDSPPGNPCQLCRNGALESLPPRTVCAEERRFECDVDGVYRDECVLIDPNDPDGGTMCVSRAPKGPACPNGLLCDDVAGFCRTFCDTAADCQAGFECEVDRCVRPPAPDMGMPDLGVPDMGVADDTGPSVDMRVERDANDSDGPTSTRPKDDVVDRGCCAVVSRGHGSGFALLWMLALVFWRRRA